MSGRQVSALEVWKLLSRGSSRRSIAPLPSDGDHPPPDIWALLGAVVPLVFLDAPTLMSQFIFMQMLDL